MSGRRRDDVEETRKRIAPERPPLIVRVPQQDPLARFETLLDDDVVLVAGADEHFLDFG
jgi:hypothetical protein